MSFSTIDPGSIRWTREGMRFAIPIDGQRFDFLVTAGALATMGYRDAATINHASAWIIFMEYEATIAAVAWRYLDEDGPSPIWLGVAEMIL
jgi:hypothetical protein